MSRSDETRKQAAGGGELREEQWQALFAVADPASEASESLLRRLAALAAEHDARSAASRRSVRIVHVWWLRWPHARPVAATLAAGLLLAAFALSVARRDRSPVGEDERSVTAPETDAHRVAQAARPVPRPSMPVVGGQTGLRRSLGPRERGSTVPDPTAKGRKPAAGDPPRLQSARSTASMRDDLVVMNDRPAASSRSALPAVERTDPIEARVRRQILVRDDFVSIPFPRLASTADSQIAAAVAAYKREAAVVDGRLTRVVTLQQKAMALADLCDRLRTETGIRLAAGQSVADEKVTLFCREMPLRDVMRQLSRPFGFTWIRSGKGGDYRYELMQDLRSQLLEEELRNRDERAALLALEQEIEQFRPYLSLSPDEARARAERARDAEKRRLELFAGTGWGPIQIYFRLSPQDLAALRAGQSLIFSQEPQPEQRTLPSDLARGVLQSNPWRLIRHLDGFTGTLDADDPKALPLTQVPEARAKLLVQMPQSELGEFSLTGFSGAFTPQRPTDRRGWSVFEGRGPYAVGRSPALAPVEPRGAGTEEPREPALRSRITLRPRSSSPVPPGSLPAGDGESSGTPSEPKVTTADVLEALYRATGMPIVADSYTRLYKPDDVSLRAQPLFAGLDRLAETMRLRWSKEGPWLQFRSATYYHDRRKEVPNRLLVRWSETRRRHGMLPLEDLVEIAQLSDAQLDAEEMRQGAVEYWGMPEWALLRLRNFRSHVRFLAEFTPAQQQVMMSAAGLEFGKMTLAQQQGFLSRTLQYDTTPLRSLEELAGATLRVDYTQPGWFQWQQPGGFDASRWAVTVDPGLPGRRVLMPPVREKTREAALQAARRAFPSVTPEMLQASRQSDPQIDATQLVPRLGQIFPTELDLVIVYIPGVTKERSIRWVRTRQDLNG